MAKQIKRFSKIALIVSLMISLLALYFVTPTVQAGTLSAREVRLSDTRLSQTNVQYDFLATEGDNTDIKCIYMQFCQAASGSCSGPTGMDASGAYTDNSNGWNNLTKSNWAVELGAATANTVKATSSVAEGLNSGGSWVIGGITNSSATGTYYVWITTYSDESCSTQVDTGTVAYAIYSGITVTATINETLNVTLNASSCEDLITGGTSATSTTTTIPYGTINTQTFYDSCQRIDISTNAPSGYVARIHKTRELTNAGDDAWIQDGTCDGGCSTTTESTWSSTNNGGFAYCMLDRSSNAAGTADSGWAPGAATVCGGGSQSFKVITNIATSAVAFMQSNSATSSNQSWIGYRLNAPGTQAAGTYSTVIIYTVTPRY